MFIAYKGGGVRRSLFSKRLPIWVIKICCVCTQQPYLSSFSFKSVSHYSYTCTSYMYGYANLMCLRMQRVVCKMTLNRCVRCVTTLRIFGSTGKRGFSFCVHCPFFSKLTVIVYTVIKDTVAYVELCMLHCVLDRIHAVCVCVCRCRLSFG